MKNSRNRSVLFYAAGLLATALYLLLAPSQYHLFVYLVAVPVFLSTRWLADNVHFKPVLLESQVCGHPGHCVLNWASSDPLYARVLGNGGFFRAVKKVPFLPVYVNKDVRFYGNLSGHTVTASGLTSRVSGVAETSHANYPTSATA